MEKNPYAPPSLENDPAASQPVEELPLATRSQRLLAILLDTLVIFGPLAALSVWSPIPLLNDLWLDESPPGQAFYSLIGFLLFLALNGYLILSRDQTIGKFALGIKVTNLKGESPSILTQAGLRYGFYWLFDTVPVVGTWLSVISVLFIFGKEHRCLHDYLAGTRVVQCRPVRGND